MDTKRTTGGSHFAPRGGDAATGPAPAGRKVPEIPRIDAAPAHAANAAPAAPAAPTARSPLPASRGIPAGARRTATPAPMVGPPRKNPYTAASRGRRGKKGSSPAPRRRGARVLSTLLIVVGVGLLLAAAGIFIHAQLGYREAQSSYKELEQYAVQEGSGDGVPNVDFDSLAAINPDVVGWIYVPGTVINYPVVKTDNNDTYLSLLFDRSGNGSGSIFMDMDDTAPGMEDQQTTLYGHHMYDGSMFKFIDDTLTQESFDQVKSVYYITRENTYKLSPLYTMQVQDTYNDARVASFGTEFKKYLKDGLAQAKAKASDASERIDSTEQVLTLVTCAGEIIPRTTRAAMVCQVVEVTPRAQ